MLGRSSRRRRQRLANSVPRSTLDAAMAAGLARFGPILDAVVLN
ncbi:hypothetical protein [Falsiroseomonas sp. E2-1-a20]